VKHIHTEYSLPNAALASQNNISAMQKVRNVAIMSPVFVISAGCRRPLLQTVVTSVVTTRAPFGVLFVAAASAAAAAAN